jgi:hypothetical protein
MKYTFQNKGHMYPRPNTTLPEKPYLIVAIGQHLGDIAPSLINRMEYKTH